jgi:hypothetical protein
MATACVAPTATDVDDGEVSRGELDRPPPGPLPPLCYAMPNCSSEDYVTPYYSSLQRQLGCGTTVRFSTGATAGFLGGLASFCPDNWWTRYQLRNNHLRGWANPYCNDCLTIPPGQLFVFWTTWTGPGCPGGCEPMPPPGGF